MPNIQELAAMPEGMPVVGLNCTVKQAFAPQRGEGQFGPWTRMDLILADDSGEIKASWWEPTTEDHQAVKGSSVSVNAYKDKKGKLAGATSRPYLTKDGAEVPALTIRGDCLRQSDSAGRSVPNPSAPSPAPRSPATAPHSAFQGHSVGEKEILEAASRWAMAFRAILTGVELTEPPAESVSTCVNTLIIAATNGKLRLEASDD